MDLHTVLSGSTYLAIVRLPVGIGGYPDMLTQIEPCEDPWCSRVTTIGTTMAVARSNKMRSIMHSQQQQQHLLLFLFFFFFSSGASEKVNEFLGLFRDTSGVDLVL